MPNQDLCPLCQQPNLCALLQAENNAGDCWCMQAKIASETLARIPLEQVNKACICPACANLPSRKGTLTAPLSPQASS